MSDDPRNRDNMDTIDTIVVPRGVNNVQDLLSLYVDGGREFPGSRLSSVDLGGAVLDDSNLRGADFEWSRMSQVSMARCNLRWSSFKGAVLERAVLEGTNLQGADLSTASLREANLRWSGLSTAKLVQANLQAADLRQANLKGANLQSALMQGARLDESDLTGADLQGAWMQDANLGGAILHRADLRGTDLQGALIWGADFTKAIYDHRTQWPEDVTVPEEAELVVVSRGSYDSRPERLSRVRLDIPEKLPEKLRCRLVSEPELEVWDKVKGALQFSNSSGALVFEQGVLKRFNPAGAMMGEVDLSKAFLIRPGATIEDDQVVYFGVRVIALEGSGRVRFRCALPHDSVSLQVPVRPLDVPFISRKDLAKLWPLLLFMCGDRAGGQDLLVSP